MHTPIPRQEIEERIKEIENDEAAPLSFPKKLNSPHAITSNTKSWFDSANYNWERKSKNPLILPLSIDKKYLSRALMVVDFLVKLLEHRGYTFEIDSNGDNIILISGRKIHMSIRNVGKYEDNDTGSYKSRDFVLTEVLCVQIFENTWNRKEWKDTPYSPIEEKLTRVVAYTELFAEYSHRYQLMLEERWRNEAIVKDQEIEKQKKKEREKEKIKKLMLTADNFDRARKIEIYLNERRAYSNQKVNNPLFIILNRVQGIPKLYSFEMLQHLFFPHFARISSSQTSINSRFSFIPGKLQNIFVLLLYTSKPVNNCKLKN